MERAIRHEAAGGNHFLPAPSSGKRKFINTGSTLLNLVLGGGWPLGRIANVVGDKSTGKTLLAIEAAANFAKLYPRGKIWYREAEAAFDVDYARTLGMPEKAQYWPENKEPFDTVEQFFNDLRAKADWCIKHNRPGLYILDSLDSLSDEKEMLREIDKASYGGDKAKQMSQLFRKLIRKIRKANMFVLIISQVRDKIGISFGRKTTRSGGRALDFYASQVVYLAHIKTVYRKHKGQKRATEIRIKAKCDKNKIAAPFRECVLQIRFGYGVDDLRSNMDWLKESKALKRYNLMKDLNTDWDKLPNDEYNALLEKSRGAVITHWGEVEQGFIPKRKKY